MQEPRIGCIWHIRNSNGLSLITSHFTLPWNYLSDLNFSSPFNLESGNGKKSINNLLQGAHWYETAPIDSKRTLVEWWNGSQLSTERGDLLNFGYWVLRFDKILFPTVVVLFRHKLLVKWDMRDSLYFISNTFDFLIRGLPRNF